MSLNPNRSLLNLTGMRSHHEDSPFQAEAEVALAGFRAIRSDLERQVRRGDLTVKLARQKAEAAAASMRADLLTRADTYSPVPRAFLDRLVDASESRRKARSQASLETLQRDTNELLRQSIIEQQMQTRAAEFEGRSFRRSVGGGVPAPTIESLLQFHQEATVSGDDSAREWARRQLESRRSQTFVEADLRRIDLACDRPDRINPRLITTYLDAMRGEDADALETFVAEALRSGDSNACCAAFVLAREAPEGPALRWVRRVLDGVPEFPDAALAALRSSEADARSAEAEGARTKAEFAIALADAEGRFSSLEAPTEAELEQQERFLARPRAALGEPIGLALDRRGATPEEFDALSAELFEV
ncbi:hypothetical protein EP7_005050 [Isosphaeraceae bacterium EP7]